MDINELERRYVIDLLENGNDIPEDFRNKLFPLQKQEYELSYAGKMRKEDILADEDGSFPVPLEVEKVFGENKENDFDWKNLLVFGDNLQFLKTIYKNEDSLIKDKVKGKIKLVYIDPPFATTEDFKSSDGAKAYSDKKKGSEFIEYIRKRLIMLREVLADDGSIFVHLDWKKSHYIKVVLDEVFGEKNFVNEIVWHYPDNFQGNVNGFANNHDVIFWYSKTSNYTANKVMIPLPKVTKRDKRVWSAEEKKLVSARDENGKLIYENFTEKKADDVWDIGQSSTTKKNNSEYIDYPTQKPEELIKRIILAASNEGDLVMDCFAGSGTVASVAERLNRKWITCDIGKLSFYTIQRRMIQIDKAKDLLSKSKKKYNKACKPFVTCSLGVYELSKTLDLEWEKYKQFVSELFDVELKKQVVGGIEFDGLKDGFPVIIYPYNKYKESNIDENYLNMVNSAVGSRFNGSRIYIISPQRRVDFLTDYEELDGTRFYFLKIPYQYIEELHQKPFAKVRQPRSKSNINAVDESIGFSFNHPPVVDTSIKKTNKNVIITVNDFDSKEPMSGRMQDEKCLSQFDTLSAIFIDNNYDGNCFSITDIFFREDLEIVNGKLKICFDKNDVGDSVMLVFIDVFGNEFKEEFEV